MEKEGVRITERDLDLMRTINSFGFVDMGFVSLKYDLKPNVVYRLMRRLTKSRLMRHHYMYHQKPGIYQVTTLGVELCHDELPPLVKVSQSTYEHNLAVSKTCLVLARQHQGQIITERQIRHRLGKTGVGKPGHVADGVLLVDGKKIALEVELSAKGKDRLTNILQDYAMQIEYDAVWYICGNPNLYKRFQALAPQYTFIKCYLLQDILRAGE